MTEPSTDDFALFVSAVPGRLVQRYGTRDFIGHLSPAPGKRPEHVTGIVALTAGEYARYRREYDRALDWGTLIRRTREEWLAER